MRNLLLTSLIAATLLTGCCKDDDSNPASGHPIRFDNLAVGQTSRYLGLTGENYFSSSNDDYSYSNDTLVLSIVSEDASGFKIREEMHYLDTLNAVLDYEKDSIYYYYLNVKDDSLRVTPVGTGFVRSRIFSPSFWYHNTALPLHKTDAANVEIVGWKTSFPYCECRKEGLAAEFTLFGVSYKDLNVIRDDASMAVDGPGQTYVYAPSYGIVRFTEVSWWTQSGYGWDLLPE